MNDFDNEMNLKQRENISFSQQKDDDSTESSINWLKFAFIKQAHFNSCSDGWIMYFTMWQRNKAQFFFVQFNQKYAHFEFLFLLLLSINLQPPGLSQDEYWIDKTKIRAHKDNYAIDS